MNVKDVKSIPLPVAPLDQADMVLQRQEELENQYWMIEKRKAPTFSVNNQDGQILIKDFLWRITEEVGESLEALHHSEEIDKVHEELADALHFVAGLGVITCSKPQFRMAWMAVHDGGEIIEGYADMNFYLKRFVKDIGVLGNTLKMKPWKQTPVLTDASYFDRCYHDMVASFLSYCVASGLNLPTLLDFYYRKSEVNLFRIRSNY